MGALNRVHTPDAMTYVKLELPAIWLDSNKGTVCCSECGQIGATISKAGAARSIRSHYINHVMREVSEVDMPRMIVEEY